MLRTAAMVWAELQVAVLARVYHLAEYRPIWYLTGQSYSLELHGSTRSACVLLDRDVLTAAFRGEERQHMHVLQTVRALVDAVVSSGTPRSA
jgi:hypothetical protein